MPSGRRLDRSRLEGCIPKLDHIVTIEEMNQAILDGAAESYLKSVGKPTSADQEAKPHDWFGYEHSHSLFHQRRSRANPVAVNLIDSLTRTEPGWIGAAIFMSWTGAEQSVQVEKRPSCQDIQYTAR